MQFRKYLFLVTVLAVLAGACSSGDDAASDDSSSDDASAVDDAASGDAVSSDDPPDDTPSEPATDDATTDGGEAIAYEIFSSDEGAGCGVFVSVPSDVVDDSTDARAVLWAGVVAQDFTSCGFSDIVEAGLITVNGLDEYDQPDWSTVEEHAYFTVTGWDALIADCHTAELTDECAAALEASLVE